MKWQLRDAKNQFSKLVRDAQKIGPQIITLRGKPAVAVISIEYYERLSCRTPTLVDHLLFGPKWDDEFAEDVNARNKSPLREVDLDE